MGNNLSEIKVRYSVYYIHGCNSIADFYSRKEALKYIEATKNSDIISGYFIREVFFRNYKG